MLSFVTGRLMSIDVLSAGQQDAVESLRIPAPTSARVESVDCPLKTLSDASTIAAEPELAGHLSLSGRCDTAGVSVFVLFIKRGQTVFSYFNFSSEEP
jgi:hypothetical protein